MSLSRMSLSLFNKAAFYPTLYYNLFMTKFTARRWFNRIDETVVLGALPFQGMTKWVNIVTRVFSEDGQNA